MTPAERALPVDTKEEAYASAMRSDPGGLQPRCDTEPRAKSRIDPDGGVDITFVVHRDCEAGTLDELIIHVAEDGTLAPRDRRPLDITSICGPDAH